VTKIEEHGAWGEFWIARRYKELALGGSLDGIAVNFRTLLYDDIAILRALFQSHGMSSAFGRLGIIVSFVYNSGNVCTHKSINFIVLFHIQSI